MHISLGNEHSVHQIVAVARVDGVGMRSPTVGRTSFWGDPTSSLLPSTWQRAPDLANRCRVLHTDRCAKALDDFVRSLMVQARHSKAAAWKPFLKPDTNPGGGPRERRPTPQTGCGGG